MESKYVKALRQNEIKKYDHEMLRRKLKKIVSENGSVSAVRKHYNLTTEEKEILNELEMERSEQAKHDKAFLAGWNSGEPLYEKRCSDS